MTLLDPQGSMEVTRSLYAQMCHFHEETEQHRVNSEKSTRKTAILVQSIGTLLLIFTVVIGVYMTQLTNQFIQIVDSIERMNTRAETISQYMSAMTADVSRMNDHVAHMHAILNNMKTMNQHVAGMEHQVGEMTVSLDQLNQLGTTARETVHAMNLKMDRINQATARMNFRMYQISKPMKMMPKH